MIRGRVSVKFRCSAYSACLVEEGLPIKGILLVTEPGGLNLPQPFWGIPSVIVHFGGVGDLWLLISKTRACI